MGLSDRDYMYEKRSTERQRSSGGGSGRSPPDPDWKTIVLGLSLIANGLLLYALFAVCGW